jgi:hypothetical protein
MPEYSTQIGCLGKRSVNATIISKPILYEDAANYMRNEPQRAQRTQRKKKEANKIWRSLIKKWYYLANL